MDAIASCKACATAQQNRMVVRVITIGRVSSCATIRVVAAERLSNVAGSSSRDVQEKASHIKLLTVADTTSQASPSVKVFGKWTKVTWCAAAVVNALRRAAARTKMGGAFHSMGFSVKATTVAAETSPSSVKKLPRVPRSLYAPGLIHRQAIGARQDAPSWKVNNCTAGPLASPRSVLARTAVIYIGTSAWHSLDPWLRHDRAFHAGCGRDGFTRNSTASRSCARIKPEVPTDE